MKFVVRRYGSREGLVDIRNGIWFEILNPVMNKFTTNFYKTYREGKMYYAIIDVQNPYFIYVRHLNTEGYFPLYLYQFVFKYTPEKVDEIFYSLEKYYITEENKRIADAKEHAYAVMERNISNELRKRGFDSAIFIHNIEDEILFNYGEYSAIISDQIFYLDRNVEWLN